MGNESGRQGVEVEVAHSVGAYHHCRLLLLEGIDDGLQCMWRGIEVVAVELHGKSSAALVVDCHIPASAYSQVIALRNNMNKMRRFLIPNQFRSSIRGVVVNDDDVVFEVCLLLQCTSDGVEDSLLTVSDGDNHRSLYWKVLLVEVGILIVVGIHESPDGIEMARSHLLHLNLHLTVGGIDIIELLHTACPEVAFLLCI